MGKSYVKIFLVFWLVSILVLLGSNVLVHFMRVGPDKHLTHYETDELDGPGARLLQEIVSDAVNYNYTEVRDALRQMPQWASSNFYFIDADGKDLLRRELPDTIRRFAARIDIETPYVRQYRGDRTLFGRQITLRDGELMRVVVFSPARETAFRWRLYINNVWHILLLSLLASGAACYYLARYFTRDIRTLTQATQQIARGNLDIRLAEKFGDRPGEIAELGRAFDNMVIKLKKTMDEQRRLIKDVSHELRSPLARLQVALAIAQQRANTEITDELDRIKKAADYLNDVISNILSLPLTAQDSWELVDVVDISSMLSVIISTLDEEAEQRGVKLVRTDGIAEALVHTRGNSLNSVFGNVIRNAVRYTSDDSEVKVTLQRCKPNSWQINVTDSGPGVPEDQLEDIFEPFYRTDEARCRKSGGYGLGLAIAKRTVVLHSGSIFAKNISAGGLVVTITLPSAEEEFALIDDDDGSRDHPDTLGHHTS